MKKRTWTCFLNVVSKQVLNLCPLLITRLLHIQGVNKTLTVTRRHPFRIIDDDDDDDLEEDETLSFADTYANYTPSKCEYSWRLSTALLIARKRGHHCHVWNLLFSFTSILLIFTIFWGLRRSRTQNEVLLGCLCPLKIL